MNEGGGCGSLGTGSGVEVLCCCTGASLLDIRDIKKRCFFSSHAWDLRLTSVGLISLDTVGFVQGNDGCDVLVKSVDLSLKGAGR